MPITIPAGDWTPSNSPPPTELSAARQELHWAAQVIPAVADAFLPQVDDDSHTNMSWREDLGAFVGQMTPQGFCLGLRLDDATLLFLDDEGEIVDEKPLEGATLDDALEWTSAAIVESTSGVMSRLVRPDYAMPAHPIASGGTFGPPTPAHDALAVWFDSAARALEVVAASEPGASPVRCWPHHFDIATLITVNAEARQQIGVGLSPGDQSYDEPYLYCSPYPKPKGDLPQTLQGKGAWHTAGFTSAVLKGSDITPTPAAAGDQVAEYLTSALSACHTLIGA